MKRYDTFLTKIEVSHLYFSKGSKLAVGVWERDTERETEDLNCDIDQNILNLVDSIFWALRLRFFDGWFSTGVRQGCLSILRRSAAALRTFWLLDRLSDCDWRSDCRCLCTYYFITTTRSGCPSGSQPTWAVYTAGISCFRNSEPMALSKVNMQCMFRDKNHCLLLDCWRGFPYHGSKWELRPPYSFSFSLYSSNR